MRFADPKPRPGRKFNSAVARRSIPGADRPGADRGAVLVGLLWCLVLLSVLVIGLLHSGRTDLQLARHHADRIQARYLAMAGIERAKALLYQDARERSRSGRNHSGALSRAPEHFRDIAFGRGIYRVIRPGRPDEGGGVVFGVSDEESLLNLNTADPDDLGRLEGMTPDIPAAIADWRDGDNQVTPNGAEAEYYLAMQPPYQPRNGPFLSVRELLQVRGMPRELLLGRDMSDTGLPEMDDDDDDEGGGGPSAGSAGAGAGPSPWATLLTVHSGVRNLSATGQERINVQTADEAALTGVPGITTEIARAIVAHRGQNRLESLADLLEVRRPGPSGPGGGQQPGSPGFPGPQGPGQGPPGEIVTQGGGSGRGRGGGNGPTLIDQRLLMDIADSLTTDSESLQAGVVNVNTAGLEVLACLPGVSRELAQAILSYRGSAGYFASTAALLNVSGMTTEIFKQISARVTARSETYRILAEGRIRSTGVRQRVQAVVRVGLSDVETLSYRENDL
ncbi:MAG: helix-hairpin-helix domain-containing protein [Limisphaerales bacterium]